MKFLSRFLLFAGIVFLSLNIVAQDRSFRADPPSWWTGMENTGLQLMLYGDKIGETSPVINYPGVTLLRTTRLENPDYLVIDLDISQEAKPGNVPMVFEYQREIRFSMDYPLKKGRKDQMKGLALARKM